MWGLGSGDTRAAQTLQKALLAAFVGLVVVVTFVVVGSLGL